MKHLKLKDIPCDKCKLAHSEAAIKYKKNNYDKVVKQNNQSSNKYYYENNEKAKQIRKSWKLNNKDKVRSHWRKRHAIKMGLGHEFYTEQQVIDQHGTVCHICLKNIDLSLNRKDPMGFQIDHVIPLSKGGEDKLGNVKPSHAKCNQQKGSS